MSRKQFIRLVEREAAAWARWQETEDPYDLDEAEALEECVDKAMKEHPNIWFCWSQGLPSP